MKPIRQSNWSPEDQMSEVRTPVYYDDQGNRVVFAPPSTPVPPRTNGFAIASMVLGILWIYWIGSVLALVFGYKAKQEIAASNGGQGGAGMATAGIVLGWVGVATFVISLGFFIAAIASGGAYS
jgi:uncharacterized membrane protein